MSAAVRTNIDLFADDVLLNPYGVYREMRDSGPLLYLERHDVWAVPRYCDVRAALGAPEILISGKGVGLNDEMNTSSIGTIIATDPPRHAVLRSVLADRLSPRAVKSLEQTIEAQADALVADLVQRGTFDAVDDLARKFPVSVVMDLIGLPEEGRDVMLDWADASWNVFGPMNERTITSIPRRREMRDYLLRVATRDRLTPGSMGLAVYEAADRGTIGYESCIPLLAAYTVAGMDTTINALGHAVWLFARHPEQWDLVRSGSVRIPSVFNEILRYEPPVQLFARYAEDDYPVAGAVIPRGSRVVLVFGSANRDERRWDDPDRFDVKRDATAHLSFGYGIHYCVGAGLAKLEALAVLTALAKRVRRFHAGEPERRLNNVLRGLNRLPVTIEPA
jgi:cytochrome P450